MIVWIFRSVVSQGMNHHEAQMDPVAMMMNVPACPVNTTMEGCPSFETEASSTPSATRYPAAPAKGRGKGKGAMVRQEESGKKRRTPPRKRQRQDEEVEREKSKERQQDGDRTPETEGETPYQQQEEGRRPEGEDDDIMVLDQDSTQQIMDLDEDSGGEIQNSLRTFCRKTREKIMKLHMLLRTQCDEMIRDKEIIRAQEEKIKLLEKEVERLSSGGSQSAVSKGPMLKSAALYQQLLENAGLSVKKERD